MASIAVTTAGYLSVVESREQMTLPAAAAILAGDTVSIDSNGKFVKGDADGAGLLTTIYGIALRSVAAGEPVTAVRRGVLSGWTFGSTAYWTAVQAHRGLAARQYPAEVVADTESAAVLAAALGEHCCEVMAGAALAAARGDGPRQRPRGVLAGWTELATKLGALRIEEVKHE